MPTHDETGAFLRDSESLSPAGAQQPQRRLQLLLSHGVFRVPVREMAFM